MAKRLAFVLTSVIAMVASCLVWASSASAAPVDGGTLTSGKAVSGTVSTVDGISYTFKAVAGKHVTLAITKPKVSPVGSRLQMQVYDSSGAVDANGVYIGTSPVEIDFTPTTTQAGTTRVVISQSDAGARGTFTLTYARDVTGKLTSGTAKKGRIKHQGQHAEYTFTAVAGKHVTLAITKPKVSPVGSRLQMQVYDSSGAVDANGVYIGTSPVEIDFTPTTTQAGTTRVVISQSDAGTTGSFTLTYARDVTGKLTSGTAKKGRIRHQGQHAEYTFTAVAGKHVTLAITKPKVSPVGSRLQMQVYDSSGATDANGVYIGTSPVQIDFTPTATQAGTTRVVISQSDAGATGSFTLTYTAG